MIYRYLFSIFLCAILFDATSAAALTCRNDYAGVSGCASNATAAGDCASLGYSKTDNADCGHYILCPFDPSYKMCVSQKCTNYTLSACPENGVCVSCQSGDNITYALIGCEDGWKIGSDGTCVSAYSSCRDAGYYDDNQHRKCETTTAIQLSDGSSKLCYVNCVCGGGYEENEDGNCVKSITSCRDAGYYDDNQFRKCESSTNIQLSDGSSKLCYVNCVCGGGYEEDEDGDCVPQQCPTGTEIDINCIGNTLPVPTGSYSGSDACYECQSCSENYVTDINFCGPSGARGWTLSSSDKDTIGCQKCVAKACPSDSAVNKQCLVGQTRVTAGYSGNSLCYRCEGDPTTTPTATCETAGCAKGQYLCSGKCTNYADSTSCTYCTGNSSSGGSSVGGGGSACDPIAMDECEYKICVDSNYCITGAGSGGMDPMCCEIDKEEGTVGGTTPVDPFG